MIMVGLGGRVLGNMMVALLYCCFVCVGLLFRMFVMVNLALVRCVTMCCSVVPVLNT